MAHLSGVAGAQRLPAAQKSIKFNCVFPSFQFYTKKQIFARHLTLEALAMNDGGTRLVVFLFGNPHLLECRKGREDGTTNPN